MAMQSGFIKRIRDMEEQRYGTMITIFVFKTMFIDCVRIRR